MYFKPNTKKFGEVISVRMRDSGHTFRPTEKGRQHCLKNRKRAIQRSQDQEN